MGIRGKERGISKLENIFEIGGKAMAKNVFSQKKYRHRDIDTWMCLQNSEKFNESVCSNVCTLTLRLTGANLLENNLVLHTSV